MKGNTVNNYCEMTHCEYLQYYEGHTLDEYGYLERSCTPMCYYPHPCKVTFKGKFCVNPPKEKRVPDYEYSGFWVKGWSVSEDIELFNLTERVKLFGLPGVGETRRYVIAGGVKRAWYSQKWYLEVTFDGQAYTARELSKKEAIESGLEKDEWEIKKYQNRQNF